MSFDASTKPPGSAQQGPADFVGWETALREAYRHYETIRAKEDQATRCERVQPVARPERLRADIKSAAPQIFSRLWVEISRLVEGADAYAAFLGEGIEAPDFCIDKATHLILAWDGWLIELHVPCSAGQLAHYDIGDFLGFLDGLLSEQGRPAQALLSRCGQMKAQPIALDELVKLAAETRNLWGKDYPARRTAARASAE
jgi:hypothetical protein